jgi:YVTN family beta-propeller protein
MRGRLAGLILGSALALQNVAAGDAYEFLNEIPIGGEGGWDILTVDSAARRLYVSHSTKVVVIDLEKNAVTGEIADTPGVHGMIPVPELQRGFTTNGKEDKSSVVDLSTLKTTSKIETGKNPDAFAYDAKRGEVYIFNHSGDSATVIDAKNAKAVATIQLGGSPEFGVSDDAAGRVYVNLEDKSEVAVIDAAKHEVVARWPLAPGTEPTGIALDAAHHRLFAACHNKLMVMVDTTSGKVVASVPIGAGRGWLRVRGRDAARFRVVWRRYDHDRERRRPRQIDDGPNFEDRTERANDGDRSEDAPDLFTERAIRVSACAGPRRDADPTEDGAEYNEGFGLSAG